MTPSAAQPPTGFLSREIELREGGTLPYVVYVPPGDPLDGARPAILFLHGVGERGTDGLLQTQVGIGPAIRRRPSMVPFIVVMPQCLPDAYWRNQEMEAGALEALDRSGAEHRMDPARVYLTGISMGGIGAWHIASRHPERFAALVPICGIGKPAVQAAPLRDVPVWCFHGADDPVIPAACSRAMVESLRSAGGEVKYTEYPGVGHDSWTRAYDDPQLYAWLLSKSKRPLLPAPGP